MHNVIDFMSAAWEQYLPENNFLIPTKPPNLSKGIQPAVTENQNSFSSAQFITKYNFIKM